MSACTRPVVVIVAPYRIEKGILPSNELHGWYQREKIFVFCFLILFFYWSVVDLQRCVSFRCTAKWFSYIYTCIYILFQILFPYRLLQNIEYSSLCYTVGPCCRRRKIDLYGWVVISAIGEVWLMQMHSAHWWGGEETKSREKSLCLNFSCLALKYEFYFIRTQACESSFPLRHSFHFSWINTEEWDY